MMLLMQPAAGRGVSILSVSPIQIPDPGKCGWRCDLDVS